MDIEELIEDLDEMVRMLNNDDITGLVTWLSLSSSASEIRSILKKYKVLYEAVDNMFYDIANQWENWMDIEVLVGDLRNVMYGKPKEEVKK